MTVPAVRLRCPQGEGDAMQASMEVLLYEHGVDMIFSGVCSILFAK